MIARCPDNPDHVTFITVAHVAEDWLVDQHGNFISSMDSGKEIAAEPDKDNTWTCATCGMEATVEDD